MVIAFAKQYLSWVAAKDQVGRDPARQQRAEDFAGQTATPAFGRHGSGHSSRNLGLEAEFSLPIQRLRL